MRISGGELERARGITEDLFEEMGLEAYLYEVEPRDGDGAWEVCVECAVREGWQRSVLVVDKERLLAVPRRPGDRAALLEQWEMELVDCRREGGG